MLSAVKIYVWISVNMNLETRVLEFGVKVKSKYLFTSGDVISFLIYRKCSDGNQHWYKNQKWHL